MKCLPFITKSSVRMKKPPTPADKPPVVRAVTYPVDLPAYRTLILNQFLVQKEKKKLIFAAWDPFESMIINRFITSRHFFFKLFSSQFQVPEQFIL